MQELRRVRSGAMDETKGLVTLHDVVCLVTDTLTRTRFSASGSYTSIIDSVTPYLP